MTRTRSWLAIWLFTALLMALVPRPASACSCLMIEPEEAVATADAAFVGTLSEQRGERWVFEVEAVLAGQLPTPLEMRMPVGDGGNCGLFPNAGQRYGLVLHREPDGNLSSSSCSSFEPDDLLAAGDPQPPDAATPVSTTPEDADPAADDGGGTVILLGTVLGAAAVLGGVALWGRRTT